MKQLAQIIAIFLFGLNALELIIAAGVAVVMIKMFFDKISNSRRRRKTRNRNKEIERNMWAIE